VHHARVTAAEQAAHHVRAHPTQSDHTDLHRRFPFVGAASTRGA
jgi:hypothetical protein